MFAHDGRKNTKTKRNEEKNQSITKNKKKRHPFQILKKKKEKRKKKPASTWMFKKTAHEDERKGVRTGTVH